MQDHTDRFRPGIALGGGGARGFAHVGILQVLAENGIVPACVAGTSIGALVGAVYAGGGLERLAASSNEIRLLDIPRLLSPSWSLRGVFSGNNVIEWLSGMIEQQTFAELDVPFAALATDIDSGERVVLRDGEVSSAVRASISIPGLFTPIVRDGRTLVDGGLVDPLPVGAAHELGAGFVIAVDLFGDEATVSASPSRQRNGALDTAMNYIRGFLRAEDDDGRERHRGPNVLEAIERTMIITQHELTQARLVREPADFRFEPPVGDIGALDFHRGEEGIEIGRETARKRLPELLAALEHHRRRHSGIRGLLNRALHAVKG